MIKIGKDFKILSDTEIETMNPKDKKQGKYKKKQKKTKKKKQGKYYQIVEAHQKCLLDELYSIVRKVHKTKPE